MHCIHKRKTAEITITKCLFRLEPSKKHSAQAKIVEGLASEQTGSRREYQEKLKQAKREQDDYEDLLKQSLGMPISYGQGVVLRHLFSDAFVSLEVKKMAKLLGNVQVVLSKTQNEYSSMRFLPLSQLRKLGDQVCYSDEVAISNLQNDHYYLHISEFLNSREEGLEVNGSELKTEWRPVLYLPFSSESALLTNPNIIRPGDVVQIHNKAIGGGFLSVTRASIQDMTLQKSLITTGGMSNGLLNKLPLSFAYLMNISSMNTEVAISESQNFYTLWELQRVYPLDSSPPQYFHHGSYSVSAVRLKNISTQYYLASDPHHNDRLQLTLDGLNTENLFFISSKSSLNVSGPVCRGDIVNIQNCRGRFVQPMKNTKVQPERVASQSLVASRPMLQEISGGLMQNPSIMIGDRAGTFSSKNKDTEFRFGLSSKSDPSQISFDIENSSPEIVQLGNKLSNLLSQFVDFYLYLQEWGIDFTSATRKRGAWNFNYESVLKYEKELESEVELFNTNLGNLYEFLCGDRPKNELTQALNSTQALRKLLSQKRSIQFDSKKELLVEQRILEILMLILQLIEFKTIGTLRAVKVDKEEDKDAKDKKERKPEVISYSALKNYNWDKFEQLPQLIAKTKLERTLGMILKVFLLAAWRNHTCSFHLSLHLNFFENLLEFYPNEIIELCSEVANNLGCEKHTYTNFLAPWPNMLEEVNERSGNIKKQIFLLQLLQRLMVNHRAGEVYPPIQSELFRLLYNNKQGSKGLKLIKFGLQPASTLDDEGKAAEVMFVTANSKFWITLSSFDNVLGQQPIDLGLSVKQVFPISSESEFDVFVSEEVSYGPSRASSLCGGVHRTDDCDLQEQTQRRDPDSDWFSRCEHQVL